MKNKTTELHVSTAFITMIALSCRVKTGGRFQTWLKMPIFSSLHLICSVRGLGCNYKNDSRRKVGSYVQRIVLHEKMKFSNGSTLTQSQFCSYFHKVLLCTEREEWKSKTQSVHCVHMLKVYYRAGEGREKLQQWINIRTASIGWTLYVVGGVKKLNDDSICELSTYVERIAL